MRPETPASRDRIHAVLCDVVDILRALDHGRPVPEHVHRNRQTRAKERALEWARRHPLDRDV